MEKQAEEIIVEGKAYVTLDRASEVTGYEREYLRKMSVAGKIEAVRIGTTRLVNLESIEAHKNEKPQRKPHKN